jgi:O-antigen/teichoic acid export membrane protein
MATVVETSDLSPRTASDEFIVNAPPLRANIVWAISGWCIYSGCQWLLLIVLARLGSVASVSQFGLALAVTAPILIFANLQLRLVQATDSECEYAFSDYLSLRYISVVLAMIAICAVALSMNCTAQTKLVIVLMGAAKAIEAVSDVYHGSFQRHERMDLFSRSLLIKGPLSVVLFTLVFVWTQSLAWAVLGLAASWAAVLIWHDIVVGRMLESRTPREYRLRFAENWPKLRRLTMVALPLGLVTGLTSLEVNAPRYFVAQWGDETALANFTALAYLLVAGEMIVVALTYAVVPRLAKLNRVDSRCFWITIGKTLLGVAMLGVLGCTVIHRYGSEILESVFGASYATEAGALMVLAVAAALQYCATTIAHALRAMRKFQTLLAIRVFTISILLVSCAFLVTRHGIWGAAVSMLISAIVHLVIATAICGSLMLSTMNQGPNQDACPQC